VNVIQCAASTLGLVAVAALAAGAAQSAPDRRVPDAARQKDRAGVSRLLDARADVNARQPDGATALHWAAHWNDLEMARLLVGKGADVNAANDLGATPLALACTNASVEMATVLIKAGARPDLALSSGETPLMTAARSGNAALIELLITAGAQVDARETVDGQTALMWAAADKRLAAVRRLIERGADVHARSTSGFTPILFAARAGDVDVATTLLNAGANVNDAGRDGATPLLVAAVRGRLPLARLLLEKGANPNADATGYTPLHWAAGGWETELTGSRGIAAERDDEWSALAGLGEHKRELVQLLLKHGANVNAVTTKVPPRVGFTVFNGQILTGATPFFLAAFAADRAVMQVLADAGADTKMTNGLKTTPLMAAAGVGRPLAETNTTAAGSLAAATLALELGNDVNAANAAGDTALHGAAHIRADALVQFLADKGANLNAANKRGETPLFIAERTLAAGTAPLIGRSSTGDLLRKLGAIPPPARR
jgi:ankyrin repeat protein